MRVVFLLVILFPFFLTSGALSLAQESTTSSPARNDCNGLLCKGTNECIPIHWRCDGEEDCPSKEDEINCDASSSASSSFTCPPESHFSCGGRLNRCIPHEWACDGTPDCESGADEQNCDQHSCFEGQFRCRANSICVPFSFACDGQNDCPDGEDESRDTCQTVCVKNNNRFLCPSSNPSNLTCIYDFYLCDGANDCPDGADERPENCDRSG